MSHRPIIDAGPGLKTVQDEVFRKSQQDARFHAAATVWRKLTPRWMQILADDQTPEIAAVVHRITRQPMEQRLKHPKDLGETMVIAHAVVAAESGETVTVLIDDGPGARTATSEIHRLKRLHASMQTIYARLRCLDDGLPPIEKTNLLASARWP